MLEKSHDLGFVFSPQKCIIYSEILLLSIRHLSKFNASMTNESSLDFIRSRLLISMKLWLHGLGFPHSFSNLTVRRCWKWIILWGCLWLNMTIFTLDFDEFAARLDGNPKDILEFFHLSIIEVSSHPEYWFNPWGIFLRWHNCFSKFLSL